MQVEIIQNDLLFQDPDLLPSTSYSDTNSGLTFMPTNKTQNLSACIFFFEVGIPTVILSSPGYLNIHFYL